MKYFILFPLAVIIIGVIEVIYNSLEIKKSNKRIAENIEIIESYEHNRLWDLFINNINKFVYKGKYEYKPNKFAYVWYYGKNRYKINVWVDDEEDKIPIASIHTNIENKDSNIVLTSYNKEKSRKLASLLLEKI